MYYCLLCLAHNLFPPKRAESYIHQNFLIWYSEMLEIDSILSRKGLAFIVAEALGWCDVIFIVKITAM